MKLIVGLGNFPVEYDNSRHNAGFIVIDQWLANHSLSLDQSKFNGKFLKLKINGEDFIIAKPYTYMNLSGNFVSEICNFYNITPDNVLVICDDVDTPVGKIKIKTTGSSGGQKGLDDIIYKLHTQDIKSIKIGIGRPANKEGMINWVLGKFTKQEWDLLQLPIKKAVQVIDDYINGLDFQKIISKTNLN